MEELGSTKTYIVREAFRVNYGSYQLIPKTPAIWPAESLEEARVLCQRLRLRCRHVNPFLDKSRKLSDLTSLNFEELVRRLRDLKLPTREDQDWYSWWGLAMFHFSDDQLARVWEAFDRIEAYVIQESDAVAVKDLDASLDGSSAEVPKVAYIVQKLYWEYNDNWHDLRDDEPIKAYLDRDAAEIRRLELEEAERTNWQPLRLAGGISRASSRSETEILAYFEQNGISFPPRSTIDDDDEPYEFADEGWWTTLRDTLPARRFQDVWDLFDLVRFYEVVAVELDK